MEEPGNAVTSTIRNIPRFGGTKPENYREWSSTTRAVLSMSNKDVFDVLNGSIEPVPAVTDSDTPDTPTNPVEIQRWKRACETLFSVLYLVTSGPAATLVRQYEDRTSAGGLGHGQKAWNALYIKYNSNSKEARRACYEKLVSFRMEGGLHPDDYSINLFEIRGRLNEMGEKISDERFEDILLQGLTDDYDVVKMTSFHSPNFGINEIQSMMTNLYIYRLSTPGHVNKLAGRGAAMTTTKRSRKVRCYNCHEFGHMKRDCTNSKKKRSDTPKPTHTTLLVVASKHRSDALPTQRWWCMRRHVCASAVRSCSCGAFGTTNTTHTNTISLRCALGCRKIIPSHKNLLVLTKP